MKRKVIQLDAYAGLILDGQEVGTRVPCVIMLKSDFEHSITFCVDREIKLAVERDAGVAWVTFFKHSDGPDFILSQFVESQLGNGSTITVTAFVERALIHRQCLN
jgi:hypothetical protein